MKMILASTLSGGIGYKGGLPFHCSEDLRYFKEQTVGQTVIMGRKTFESLPFEGGLPNRENFIVTNLFKNKTKCNGHVYINLEEAFKVKGSWIIGGKSVYEQMLPCVDEIHWTVVKGDYKCDTFVELPLKDFYLKESKPLSEEAVVNIWKRK